MKKTIIKFIGRLIGFKINKFNGYNIFLFNLPWVFCPYKWLIFLQESMIKDIGLEKARKIFYDAGRLQGSFGVRLYKEKFNIVPDVNDFSFFVEQAKSTGYGEMKLIEKDYNNWLFKLETKSPKAKEYLRVYGKKTYAVDWYLSGLIAGAASYLLNRKFEVEEVKCIAKGDDICQFKVKEIKLEEMPTMQELYKKYIEKNLSSTINVNTKSEVFKKKQHLYGRKYFYIDKNGAHLMKYDGISTQMSFLVALKILYDENNKGKIFVDTGIILGKALVDDNEQELRSLKNTKNRLIYSLSLLGLFGLGQFEVKKYDEKKGIIIIELLQNKFAEIYSKIWKSDKNKRIDDLNIGILKGIIDSITQKTSQVEEKECFIHNNKNCIFEIRLFS